MPYTAEISRNNPSCFLFVIDQSGSMNDVLPPAAGRTKAQGVADAINRLLQNLVIRCARGDGVRDFFHVGVFGYGANVGPAFSGGLGGKTLVPISDVGNMPARVEVKKKEDGAGGLVDIKLPVWFEPTAVGGTPMCQALALARTTLEGWLAEHPTCFPPTVIHITDGETTDGDPADAMRALTNLCSSDGNTLLFNVHLSANPNATPISFPDSEAALPDDYSRTLFRGASTLTSFMRSVASEHGFALGEGARGFVLNGDLTLVIQALDIGTRPSNLR